MSRPHLSTKTKLASALLARGDVPYSHAVLMHEEHILELYQYHHNKRYSEEGGEHFSNYEPMLIAAHRERTAKIDIPEIAKGKRIRRKEAVHKAKRTHFLAEMTPENHDHIPVEKPTGGHRIRSRGFDTTKTRTVRGRVVPRKQRRENYG